jgi:murein L,D-transpeptidase YcbB/YkuD
MRETKMPMFRGVAAVVLAGGMFVAWGGRPESRQHTGHDNATTSTSIPIADTAPAFVTRDAEGTHLWDLTRQFYQKRGNAPVWFDEGTPRPQVDELIQAVRRADREGLDPDLYNVSSIDVQRAEPPTLDVRLTYLYLHYASDLAGIIWGGAHRGTQTGDTHSDPVSWLEQALDQKRVGQSLDDLIPRHRQYTALRDALAKYKGIAQQGGWPSVPTDIKLKPAQQSPAVPIIAKRLAITGDYAGPVNDQDTTYGFELQEAVKRFQRRHRLEPDAVVGASAIAQMNVPVEERIRQLALNLQRWRSLPRDLGERHLLVNIPEYRLEVWDHDQVPLTMRVIVGKKDTPTPIFSDEMTHIVFAPYWNVPTEIVRKETLPSVMRDPAFLERTNMEVLDRHGNTVDPSSVDLSDGAGYRFRQRPGASNSLGLVKFVFPNQFNVYLHDTPADGLFGRARRSFSHGCVRLSEPEKLAQYVLGDQPEWTPERIDEAMRSGQERTVKLARPIPVYLGYWTARVSADGLLQFSDDVYGIDARQTARPTSTMAKKF